MIVHQQRKAFMFRRFRRYVSNKGLCFTASSKSNRVRISICADLDAARLETPYYDALIDGVNQMIPALSKAYLFAQEAGDETVMEEVHSIRKQLMEEDD